MFRKRASTAQRIPSAALPAPGTVAPAWVELIGRYDAVAADPSNLLARHALVEHFAVLAHLRPAIPPMPKTGRWPGFALGLDGATLQDVKLSARALVALTELIDAPLEAHASLRAAGVDIVDLLVCRAVLHHGLWRVDLAGADLERAVAMVPYERANTAERANQLRQLAAQWRSELELRQGHSPALMSRVRKAATNIGGRIVNLMHFEPSAWVQFPAPPPEIPVQDEFAHRVAEATALGWAPLGWLEDPSFAEQWGHRSLNAPMLAPTGDAILSVGGSHKNTVIAIESQLADGRVMVTSPARGCTHFMWGPFIDSLSTDPLGLAELAAIHAARLRYERALRPEAAPMPAHQLGDWIALQEQQRRIKLDFRLREGLTELEVRGTGFPDPDIAMPIVQSAAREAIAAAQAAAMAPTSSALAS